MGWRDDARKRREEDEARRSRALEIQASTLSHAARPFTQGKVIWGAARYTMEDAYEELLLKAHELGYDAVLGVGFTSPAHRPSSTSTGSGYSTVNIIAYGTGVRWANEGS
ncbi:hypothetical protein [Streptomyces sp. Ru72]|uniref:hypothetical protein n=1 Tax=Streptomyces sp. Ru72 TaxID=2080747 RepID=UPI000CDD9967|nr:hypothetical protein [Streptomyces sp. Ru72]POX53379.1 hypothetical protein C3488_05155 [Streptomyces sp. Ru72]